MAQNNRSFTISVLNEHGVVYYGKCTTLFVPYKKEIIAVLAHHTPMIMKLSKGKVIIKDGREKRHLADIDSGLIYVGDNEATVLVNL